MEREIGEVFKYVQEKLKVVEIEGMFNCTGCYFENMPHSMCVENCAPYSRKDIKSVIFIKQENE